MTDNPAKGHILKIELTPLIWGNGSRISAHCPITRQRFLIDEEDGLFWGVWPSAPIDGFTETPPLMEAAESYRADRVLSHLRVTIEGAQDTDPRLIEAWEMGRDAAIDYHQKSEKALNRLINADDTLVSRDIYGHAMAGHNRDAMMIRELNAPDDLDAHLP